MQTNESHSTYEAPEVYELGAAEELTLGCNGCSSDCCGHCKGCGGGDTEGPVVSRE